MLGKLLFQCIACTPPQHGCTFLPMLWTELVEMVKCMIVVAACLQSAVNTSCWTCTCCHSKLACMQQQALISSGMHASSALCSHVGWLMICDEHMRRCQQHALMHDLPSHAC